MNVLKDIIHAGKGRVEMSLTFLMFLSRVSETPCRFPESAAYPRRNFR